ncbi:MAG: hypothetical protein K6T83_07245 [Alicyclobacillus sp.]|nr:hypothetical protein [Alicyclobacillus sp.]
MTMSYHQDAAEAKQAMDNAYLLWSLADPLYEPERWLAYQAAVERYNAIVLEANGRTEYRMVALPWLQANGVA